MKKVLHIISEAVRQRAALMLAALPLNMTVTFAEAKRKDIQSDKFHAMLGDISEQMQFFGRKWPLDDVKRILVDDFAETMRQAGTPLHHDSRVTPSLDGRRIVQLGIQTREFYVKEAAQFIEYLYSLGNEHGVEWTEPQEVAA